MVEFKGRQVEFSADTVVDMGIKEAKIAAPPEPVYNSMVSLLLSDKIEVFENFQTTSNIELESSDGGSYRASIVQRFSSTIGEHDREGEERGRLQISMINTSTGTRIELEDSLIREDEATDQPSMAAETENVMEPIELVRDMPEKVALGYGPTHPLEEVSPTSIDENLHSMTNGEVVDLFNNWITEAIRRTSEARTPIEHGFYADGAGNVVGLVEGDRSSITFPPHNTSFVGAKFHTHPKLESLATPSAPDIDSATNTSVGTVNMVSVSGANTFLVYSEEEFEKVQERFDNTTFTGEAFRTVKGFPVTAYRVIDADRIDDTDDYIRQYRQKMKSILRENKKLKISQLNSSGLDDDTRDNVEAKIEDEYQSIVDRIDDDDDSVIQELKDGIENKGKALQLSRHIVQAYPR